ncbi:Ca2+-binding EF-hand superfamily protein [Actinokineospora baliensis]|uniref:EF-hand domain-containing protein n=1 Tax=Actinokineospora baliensis TaxID=547056 RepID=UPI00195797A6|nr:EF-hand domain-containing protein [Actinokineospora baliensis]MBM7774175.1 Ca2+-binding EF-hand superfamily protein [Actinokineospora baliensis]
MATQLQQRKYEKAFERFDVDRDGVLQRNDITAMAEIWRQTFDVAPQTDEATRINGLAEQLWADITAATDADADGTVSKTEWNAAMERPEFVDKVALPFALAVFDLADKDNSGQLSVEEMIAAQTRSGISEQETRRMFDALDTDHDGSVQRDEYAAAIREFYLSDDPNAVGNLMVGDLD